MKRLQVLTTSLRGAVIVAVLAVSAVSAHSCGDNTAELIADQRERIETALTEKEYTEDDGAYRVLEPTLPEEERLLIAAPGDAVSFLFEIYPFEGALTANVQSLLYTNRPELIGQLNQSGATLEWSVEPMTVTVGAGQVIAGVDRALTGCAPGDRLTVLITSDKAFGEDRVEQLKQNTPLMYLIEITDVVMN